MERARNGHPWISTAHTVRVGRLATVMLIVRVVLDSMRTSSDCVIRGHCYSNIRPVQHIIIIIIIIMIITWTWLDNTVIATSRQVWKKVTVVFSTPFLGVMQVVVKYHSLITCSIFFVLCFVCTLISYVLYATKCLNIKWKCQDKNTRTEMS